MMNSTVRSRVKSGRASNRKTRPVLEGLEDRLLLYATTGDHFVYGSRITWSIVPDGTNLGGVTSNLVSTLDQKFGQNNWESAFSAAFAIWENQANINLVQVGDDGAPTGEGNYQQGSTEFGDIRIGGYSQASNILAYTLLPPPNNGGSDSGDIFFNSNQQWNIGQDFDLESVAIHEIGHALGLGHSADTNAAMYAYYTGVKESIDNDDAAGIQAVWGPRKEDGIALGTSNFTSANAANITQFMNTSTNQIVLPQQDVASSAESYWFKVTTPANASANLSVVIQSAYLSELSAKVQLYNSSLVGLQQAAMPVNQYGGFVGVGISNATPNTTYYIHVFGSNTGPTGTGAYALFVNMGGGNLSPAAPPVTQVAAQADQGSGGIYEQTGGANTPANTPVDTPDIIPIASVQAQGDFLMVSPKVVKKVAIEVKAEQKLAEKELAAKEKLAKEKAAKTVQIKIAHPTHKPASHKTTKAHPALVKHGK